MFVEIILKIAFFYTTQRGIRGQRGYFTTFYKIQTTYIRDT